MSIPHKIILFFVLLVSFSFLVLLPGKTYAQDVPSPACLGSCPTLPITQAPIDQTSAEATTPSAGQTAIVATVTPPCSPAATVTANSRRGGNQNGGLLNLILQLIMLLLQMILGGGGGQITLPTPSPTPAPANPCGITPTAVVPTLAPTTILTTVLPTALLSQTPSSQTTTQPSTGQPSTYVSRPGGGGPGSSAISPAPGMGLDSFVYPPNMAENATHPGYYQLPDSTSGSTTGYETLACANRHWGSKELVGLIYTLAKRWKQKYPNGYLRIDDMNATGHEPGHTTGDSVDLDATTNGTDCVADYVAEGVGGDCSGGKFNRDATIEFAKMIIDTGVIVRIIFMDTTVNAAMDEYAKSKGASRNVSLVRPAHDSHFHIDINIPLLPTWAPDC